jgi:hypothetical protein
LNKFNLTFSGEILSGFQPADAKQEFGQLLHIDDAERLERFFSGETIILRRNLERKAAAELFQKMRAIGLVTELVKIAPEEIAKEDGTFQERSESRPPTENQNASAGFKEPARIRAAKEAQQKKREKERLRGEEKARKREESQRLRAERKAEKKAAQEDAKRLREEEKTRIAEEKQRQAEEAARRKAEELARKKAEAEAAAKRKAEEAERERLRKEEAERLAAEEAARAAAERERQQAIEAAEKLAQKKAREEEARRREAELQAQREKEQAELERKKEAERRQKEAEQKRLAALAARKEAEAAAAAAKRRAQEEAREEARRAEQEQARQEEAAQQAAIKEATRKAEAAKKAALEANKKAAAEEAARQRVLADIERKKPQDKEPGEPSTLEDKAISRGAAELARGTGKKRQKTRVKTRMEVPQRETNRSQHTSTPSKRKRQKGEPNLYSLNAFRVNQKVRGRAKSAGAAAKKYTLASLLATLAVVAIVAIRAQIPIPVPVAGADSVAAGPGGVLSILAAGRLFQHDRAGNETGEIGLQTLGFGTVKPPLAYAPGGELIVREDQEPEGSESTGDNPLWRCDLSALECTSVSGNLQELEISAFALHDLDDSLFVATAPSQELLRIDAQGEIISRANISMPRKPVLNLQSGLLFMNSAEGPAVSVFRYEAQAFGKQLDEVLLMPPPAVKAEHTRVWDFLYHRDHWWVVMYDPDTGNAGIYRFDSQWNFQNQLPLATTTLPLQISSWGEKILVNTKRSGSLLRFNTQGLPEAPLESKALLSLMAKTEQRGTLIHKGGKLVLMLALAGLVCALSLLYLHRSRALVYKSQQERGAEPLDEHTDELNWIPPVEKRSGALKQRLVSYTLLVLAACVLAVGAQIPNTQLIALLFFLSGPALALIVMLRRPTGHLGALSPRLILVDPAGTYHLGGGSKLQYRGNFLLLNDVIVFTGNWMFPAFDPAQIKQQVLPLVKGGVRVDRKTLLVKLLECRHPIALAGLAVIVSWGIALVLLLALG